MQNQKTQNREGQLKIENPFPAKNQQVGQELSLPGIEECNTEYFRYNIIILGCIASGKSTVVNNIFKKTVAQTNMIRTTMIPFHYITRTGQQATDVEAYLEKNKKINKEILENSNRLADMLRQQVEFQMGGEFLTEIGAEHHGFELRVVEMPGLNDRDTSEIYYKYLSDLIGKRFEPEHHFGTIALVVDIQQGMNTADSVKILDFLAEQFKQNPKYFANLLILINKCDDMGTGKNGEVHLKSEQLLEMEDQIRQTVHKKLAEVNNIRVNFFLISAKASMLDRAENAGTLVQQDLNIDALLQENFSMIQIRKMSKEQRLVAFHELKEKMKTETTLKKESGFKQLFDLLGQILCPQKLADYYVLRFSETLDSFTQGLSLERHIDVCENFRGPVANVSHRLFNKSGDPQTVAQLRALVDECIKKAISSYDPPMGSLQIAIQVIEKLQQLANKIVPNIKQCMVQKILTFNGKKNKIIVGELGTIIRENPLNRQTFTNMFNKLDCLEVNPEILNLNTFFERYIGEIEKVKTVQYYSGMFTPLYQRMNKFVREKVLDPKFATELGWKLVAKKLHPCSVAFDVTNTSTARAIDPHALLATNIAYEFRQFAIAKNFPKNIVEELTNNYKQWLKMTNPNKSGAIDLESTKNEWLTDTETFLKEIVNAR